MHLRLLLLSTALGLGLFLGPAYAGEAGPVAQPASAGAPAPAAVSPASPAAMSSSPTDKSAAASPPQPKAPLPPARPDASEELLEKTQPAKLLFAAKQRPSVGRPMAIGYYPRGCLQGAIEFPPTGPTWQVMRLSRNRNWGHPELVNFLERFAPLAAKATGWHGVLVGDLAQPRGGPLPYGHASHQIGLDVDIWFMPMPGHVLSREERETIPASNLVAPDGKHVNGNFSPADVAFIRTAAEQPEVERVLVNAAIKKEICRLQGDKHPAWMEKVRPWYGHNDHIHVRLRCPADSPSCRPQAPVPAGPGCGKELDYWFSERVLHPKPSAKPSHPRPLMLSDLPPACRTVLNAPARTVHESKAN